jgi:hypothetical protein
MPTEEQMDTTHKILSMLHSMMSLQSEALLKIYFLNAQYFGLDELHNREFSLANNKYQT